jgi:hypothetical protein
MGSVLVFEHWCCCKPRSVVCQQLRGLGGATPDTCLLVLTAGLSAWVVPNGRA